MFARWMLILTLLAFAVPAAADIWSPSTWLSSNNKKKGVSVSKSHKKPAAKGNTPMQTLTNTPHDFLAKTKGIISPKSKGPITKSKNQKPSMFKSMFSPEPPPQPPQTVKEFLSLKRPT